MHQIMVGQDQALTRISRHIYGQFAEHLGRCIYEGLWVGEASEIPNTRGIRNDVVEAMKRLRIPNLRWPGGCFADEYHWMDGIGPRAKRPGSINSHWGGVVEGNGFGTHEFLDLCEQVGCAPYICGNLGSGAVREMQQWVEYLTGNDTSAMPVLRRENGRAEPWKIPFWGVGNENWGCGGNMTAEQYACEFRRYATYCRNIHGNTLYRIACGPNNDDYHWTEVMMREGRPGHLMNGLSLHFYVVPGGWGSKNSATNFTKDDWSETMRLALRMDELVAKHSAIMDRFDPSAHVGLMVDEWGTWYDVEPGTNPGFLYQQNTMRDAVVAGLTLNIFNNHSRRVKLANIAQLANVLQSPILTQGEKMILTPTYHVFEMYQVHQDATLLPLQMESEQISASASRDAAGRIHVSLCNLDPEQAAEVAVNLGGATAHTITGRVLTGPAMHAHNTFDQPENVRPVAFKEIKRTPDGFVAVLPARSVVVLNVEG